MHRALLIREVVQLIIQHIRVTLDLGFNYGQRQTLYSAALTCSSFLEVALDALWYNMDSLAPLFKLSNVEEKVCHFFCGITISHCCTATRNVGIRPTNI